MKLDFLMEFSAKLRPGAEPVGKGPLGTRFVAVVEGGEFEGPRLRGTLMPSGGDWVLRDEQGVARLDVRITLATDDGAHIYVQYHGVSRPLDESPPPSEGRRATQYGDRYFMTAPRFETGDERYAWLNDLVCVGEGRSTEDGVAYRVYAVVND